VAFFSSTYGEAGALFTGVQCWRIIVLQVVPLLPFFCLDVELSVWVLIVGRPDLALFFLDGGGCRSRAQIWESEVLGRSPGRWVIADGFILFFRTGVYFDSFSSQRATGLLRLKVVLAVFFGGGGRL
jgi:hypothetical protein